MPEELLGIIVGAIIVIFAFWIGKMFELSPRSVIVFCAIVVIGFVGFIAQAPWILLVDLFAMVIAAILADALLRTAHYYAKDKPDGMTSVHLAILNPIRKSNGQSPIWLIPDRNITADERDMVERANRLAYEIRDVLRHSPISDAKKAYFNLQACEVPSNITKALWKLARLRRIAESIGHKDDEQVQKHQEIEQMISQLRAEMKHSLGVLSSLSISLVKVEVARGDIAMDKLLADLNESNERLGDLSASYAEVKALRTS